jgi:hypothetical protein
MQPHQESGSNKPKLKIKAPPLKSVPPPATRKKSGSIIGRIISLLVISGAIVAGVMIKRGQLVLPDHPLLNQWLPAKSEPAAVSEAPAVEVTSAPTPAPGIWRNEDFIEGARLFNRALADFKTYQQAPGDAAAPASIGESCRNAIARFEAALADAPPGMADKIRDYIDQCEGLLANLSATAEEEENPELAAGDDASEEAPGASKDLGIKIEMKGEAPKPKIVYVDDEPAVETAPATQPEEVAATGSRLSFPPGWDQQIPDAGGIADALHALLRTRITPSKDTVLDAGLPVYSNITTLTSARFAATRLNQPLPVKRPLDTPGFPANSLFTYTFEGEFMRGANRVTLVVDAMDRVVMSQLRFDQSATAVLPVSEKHEVFDFLNLQRRVNGEEMIGHRAQVRERIVLIESELMDDEPGADGKRTAKARIQWYIPRQMAGLMLGSRP